MREGLIERQPDRMFKLGLRLWELAARTPGALGLREVARPWMNAVHNRVGQHAQLGVLNGSDVLFIERLSARDAVANATLIGGRLPLPVSSSGIVLLAHADEDLVSSIAEKGWCKCTPHTLRGEIELRARLRQARGDGFVVLDGHIEETARGIAVPVFAPTGEVMAALGVVVPISLEHPTATIELLSAAAMGITGAWRHAYGVNTPPGDSYRGRVGPLMSISPASIEYFEQQGALL